MRKYQYPLLFHVEHKFPHWAAPCPEKGENWLFFLRRGKESKQRTVI